MNGNFFSYAETLGLYTMERVVSGRCTTLLKTILNFLLTRICSYMMKERDVHVMAKRTHCPLARIKPRPSLSYQGTLLILLALAVYWSG